MCGIIRLMYLRVSRQRYVRVRVRSPLQMLLGSAKVTHLSRAPPRIRVRGRLNTPPSHMHTPAPTATHYSICIFPPCACGAFFTYFGSIFGLVFWLILGSMSGSISAPKFFQKIVFVQIRFYTCINPIGVPVIIFF